MLFDVETSGLSPFYDEIIEFAGVFITSSGIENEISELIKLNKHSRLDSKIIELTGITDNDLMRKGISHLEIANKIKDNLKGDVLLIAHNAQFDIQFLLELFKETKNTLSNFDVLDTLTILKDRKEFPHKLSDAIVYYGLQDLVSNSHRAIDDVKATYAVLLKMDEELADIDKYINLLGFNPKYSLTTRLPNVKYVAQPYGSNIKLYNK
jgi:DNA polymerase III alpha subunit (gram-positive type)